jgi:hypothetical protein
MSEMTPDEQREVMKEAIEEWLDKQFAKFGKWSLSTIALAALAWMFYGWLNVQGWHK